MTAMHVPTEEQRKTVEAFAGYGIPEVDIANVIGIDPKTLRKHYRKELDTAFVHANARVAQSLFKQATEDKNVAAAIFWLKARAGWSEKFIVDNRHQTVSEEPNRGRADEAQETEEWLDQFGNKPE